MKLIIEARTQDLFAEYKKNQLKQSVAIVESVLHTISCGIISFGFPESEDDLYQGLPYMDLVKFESRLRIETEAAEEVMARLKTRTLEALLDMKICLKKLWGSCLF